MLTIKDLSVSEELDRKALAEVHGGGANQQNNQQYASAINAGYGTAIAHNFSYQDLWDNDYDDYVYDYDYFDKDNFYS